MTGHLKARLALPLFGAVALLIATASPAAAPPGDLDWTFDTDGRVTTDFADDHDDAHGVAIQKDGKIVAAGFAQVSGNAFALARYNTDGSLDTTFDTDGRVTTDFAGDNDQVFGVAIQEDGRIVAAGCVNCFRATEDFALARYNTDGSLDPTFDGDGRVTTDFSGPACTPINPSCGIDRAYGVAIHGGRIVAAGFATPIRSRDFALARYNTDGSLDPTFDGDGRVTTDFSGVEEAHGVAIEGDGTIVAAGHAPGLPPDPATTDFALARYNADGSLDTTFGVVGRVTTDFAGGIDEANGVAIQEDGKIVAAGCSTCFQISGPVFTLARYNTDGSLDGTFDGDGRVTSDFGEYGGSANGVAIQKDGKIVAAGCTACFVTAPRDFALARYNSDGSSDTTFGEDGKVTTDFATSDVARGVAIQEDRKIVATGSASFSGVDSDFALARYRADVDADLSITKAGPSGRVPTGRNMTYTLTVTNNGPDEASDVVVTDTLPPSAAFVGAVIDLPVGFCDPPSEGILTCHLGPIESGVERRVYITVKPTQAGMITNTASVASPTPDSVQANNADSVDTSICRLTSRRSSIPCG